MMTYIKSAMTVTYMLWQKMLKKIKKILINALFAKYKIYCENTCSFYERNFFETLHYVNNLSEKYLSLTKYVLLKKIMDALNIKDGE